MSMGALYSFRRPDFSCMASARTTMMASGRSMMGAMRAINAERNAKWKAQSRVDTSPSYAGSSLTNQSLHLLPNVPTAIVITAAEI